MPVRRDPDDQGEALYQRALYKKGGITKSYWDYRDRIILHRIEGSAVLDIGCGEGITLEKMVKHFPEKDIRGIDALNENVEICKKHNLPVEYGNVYNLDFKDVSIDTCLLIEVIEHLVNHRQALSEIFRVLKKGGLLLLLFPNDRNFKAARLLTGKLKEAFYDAGHIRQWTPALLKKELIEFGFEVVRIENIPCYFWPISLHSFMVAKKL